MGSRVAFVGACLAVVLIGLGAAGLYSYAAPPTSSVSASSSSVQARCGGQNSKGIPSGCWADDLGFIPAGYVPAPHFPNGPTFPCPPGMNSSQCAPFVASCGNGVCDPNETCGDCPIDCGTVSGQVCDPYTGRAVSSVAVCQTNLNQTGA